LLRISEKKDEHEEMATFAQIATEIVFEKRDGFGYDLQEGGEEGH